MIAIIVLLGFLKHQNISRRRKRLFEQLGFLQNIVLTSLWHTCRIDGFKSGEIKARKVRGWVIANKLVINLGWRQGFLVPILQKIPAPMAFCCVMFTTCPIMQHSFKCTLQIVAALLIFSTSQSVRLLQQSGWSGGDRIFKNRSSSLFLDCKKFLKRLKKKERKKSKLPHTPPFVWKWFVGKNRSLVSKVQWKSIETAWGMG